MERETGIELAT